MFWLFLCELKLLTSSSFLTFIISYHLLTRSNEFFEWVELKPHQTIQSLYEIIVFLKDSSDFFLRIIICPFENDLFECKRLPSFHSETLYSFFEIIAKKNEWDLFSLILVSSDYQTRRCFWFLSEYNQGCWKSKQRDFNHELPYVMRVLNEVCCFQCINPFHWINSKTYHCSIKLS